MGAIPDEILPNVKRSTIPDERATASTRERERQMHREAEYTGLIEQVQKKTTMLVGENLLVSLAYFFKSFFGSLPEKLQDFVVIMKTMFSVIVDLDYVKMRFASTISGRAKLDPKLFQRYPVDSSKANAGYESYLTTVEFINLTARMGEAHGFTPPVESAFWDAYGNRLPVRGARQGVLHVD